MATVLWEATRFVGAFALVLFLAVMASRALAQRTASAGTVGLRVLGAIGLGGGRSVAVVQVGVRVLVLGLGDKSVGLLCTLDSADEIAGAGNPPAPIALDFAALLRGAVERVKHRA